MLWALACRAIPCSSPSSRPYDQTIRKDHMNEIAEAFAELERGVHAALETYSNVHRGSGHNSMVTTHLFEQARDIVVEYLGLSKDKYVVIFCTPSREASL